MMRRVKSRYVDANNHERTRLVGVTPASVRGIFMATPLPKTVTDQNHSHGSAAGNRNAAGEFALNFGASTGLDIYNVQMSAANQRAGQLGSRDYYWAKDVTARAQRSPKPRKVFFTKSPRSGLNILRRNRKYLKVLVDVDYYIDMNDFLTRDPQPTLLYTVVPSEAAGSKDGVSWTFMPDGRLDMSVSGGARYQHWLWDYGHDSIIVKRRAFCGLRRKVVVYNIDRRNLGPHHQLVLLTPIGSWCSLPACVAACILEGEDLNRFDPIVHTPERDYVRYRVMKDKERAKVTTAICGNYTSATVDTAHAEAVDVIAGLNTTKLTLYTAQSVTGVTRSEAAILAAWARNNLSGIMPTVFPVEYAVRPWQSPIGYDQDAKALMKPFMSPILHAGFCPSATRETERDGVTYRCTGHQSACDCFEDIPSGHATKAKLHKARHAPDRRLVSRMMREFVDLLVRGNRGKLHPISVEEILATRSYTAKQRQTYESGANLPEDIPGRQGAPAMFMKSEAYVQPNDPRNIVQMPANIKARYACFIEALSRALKHLPFYCSGRPPREISERVARFACTNGIQGLAATDYSRLDGHVDEYAREFEKILILASFHPMWHEEATRLHMNQFLQDVFARLGNKYKSQFSRLSGSHETSLFNTLLNALIEYVHLRTLPTSGGGFISPEDAWARIGPKLGDDGVTDSVSSGAIQHYVATARVFGQKLTFEFIPHGKPGLPFLSRIYGPDVWTGDPASMCSVRRQLGKLHLTVSLPPHVTPLEKAIEKATSFYLTDRQTPVIGAWANRMLQLNDLNILEVAERDDPHNIRSWSSKASLEDQYPQGASIWSPGLPQRPSDSPDWMLDRLEEELPEFDTDSFYSAIAAANHAHDLLALPLCNPVEKPKPKRGVVVEGDYCSPDKEPGKLIIGTSGVGKTTAVGTGRYLVVDGDTLCEYPDLTPPWYENPSVADEVNRDNGIRIVRAVEAGSNVLYHTLDGLPSCEFVSGIIDLPEHLHLKNLSARAGKNGQGITRTEIPKNVLPDVPRYKSIHAAMVANDLLVPDAKGRQEAKPKSSSKRPKKGKARKNSSRNGRPDVKGKSKRKLGRARGKRESAGRKSRKD